MLSPSFALFSKAVARVCPKQYCCLPRLAYSYKVMMYSNAGTIILTKTIPPRSSNSRPTPPGGRLPVSSLPWTRRTPSVCSRAPRCSAA